LNLRLAEVARVTGSVLVHGDGSKRARGAVVDSRLVKAGDLFFALRGEWLDGHDFAADALRRGAAAVVVRHEIPDVRGAQLVTSDPLRALVGLSGWVRDVLDPVVVGITGSTGKTGVKDFLASIVSRTMPTVASHKSYNNELGVPLTLLATKVQTRVVICEMGARGLGQIKALCELARPQIGVVTNVGVTHYEQFGSREAIAEAKGELVRSIPEGGAAILNADDPLVMGMASRAQAEVLTFGLAENAWLRAQGARADRLGRATFRMVRGREVVWISLPISGGHQVLNALAASAAALALGLSPEDCRVGLESAVSSPWRMQVEVAGGVVLVNDAYNANPTSVASALHSCAAMASGQGRFVAVLGYMAELGEIEVAEHRRIGALAASLTTKLVVVGNGAKPIALGAREAGMNDVVLVPEPSAAVEAAGDLHPGDVLLVKGSRVAALEKLVDLVKERVAGA
jgi:UDP-N-acetylmuramoyl-tripeptide--D-alanyl-D-alanine ligase